MSLRLEDLPPDVRARVLAGDEPRVPEPRPEKGSPGIDWFVAVDLPRRDLEEPAPPAPPDPEAERRYAHRVVAAISAVVGFAAYGYGAAEYMEAPWLLGVAAALVTGIVLWLLSRT